MLSAADTLRVAGPGARPMPLCRTALCSHSACLPPSAPRTVGITTRAFPHLHTFGCAAHCLEILLYPSPLNSYSTLKTHFGVTCSVKAFLPKPAENDSRGLLSERAVHELCIIIYLLICFYGHCVKARSETCHVDQRLSELSNHG